MIALAQPARALSPINRVEEAEKDRLGLPAELLAAMPVQVLLPLRPQDHQTQDGGPALRQCGASGVAAVEHGRWRKQPFEIAKLKQVFETGWLDQGSEINWDGEEPEQKTSAWAVLEKYFTDTPIKANEMPEAVEVPVEADLSQHGLPVLIGVLDLVRAGGRIVDFKSAGKTPDNEWPCIKTACNSTATRCCIGKRPANVKSGRELHHLVKTKTPKVIITPADPMTEYQRNRLFRLMENYVDGLERQDFVPHLGCNVPDVSSSMNAGDGMEVHANGYTTVSSCWADDGCCAHSRTAIGWRRSWPSRRTAGVRPHPFRLPVRYPRKSHSSVAQMSRFHPGLVFLLDYETYGLKGLAKAKAGRLVHHQIRY